MSLNQISQICHANSFYSNVFNPLLNSCPITQPSDFEQSNSQSPIDYSVKGNRLTQAVDGSIELPPHHPVFVAGEYLKSSFDKIRTVSDYFFRKVINVITGSILNKQEIDSSSLEKFKKEFRHFSRNIVGKDLHTIGSGLLEIVPKNFELKDLVDFIFEHSDRTEILLLLKAILKSNPNFILSPYNKIRRAIVEDEGQFLTNDKLSSMLKKHRLDHDKEKKLGCYNLAYRMNYPYIYQVARKRIPSSDYTLNFLWITLNPQNRTENKAQDIFRDGINSSEKGKYITDQISRWAALHPDVCINLWYDSALVTQNAQLKTFELMRGISQSRGAHLKLRDIRRLSNIQGEIEHSLHPGTPLYYRIDLLKALITDYMLSSPEESAKYFLFSDIDIKPMTSKQIFDQRTIDYLSSDDKSYGYVFNRVGIGKFENSFFALYRGKQNIQQIHYEDLIQRTASVIAELRPYPLNSMYLPKMNSHFIFGHYGQFRGDMGESSNRDDALAFPRKVVKCPPSQFNVAKFLKSDHRSEIFRFVGDSNVPYTTFGRNFDKHGPLEAQIDDLRYWKAEPLAIP
jgi:hypothetical protein